MHKLDRNTSKESEKPSHVRKLNFCRSILTLNTVKQHQWQKDGALLIDQTLTDIPCTKKNDFVRKWIEAHNDYVFRSDETFHLSPVLGSSNHESVETSPIFGNPRKRTRQKTNLNNNVIEDTKDADSHESRNVKRETSASSIENNKRARKDDRDKKEHVKRNLFDSQSVDVPFQATDLAVSPVLDRNSYSYKRRRRKLKGRRALDRIDNKYHQAGSLSPVICSEAHRAEKSPILSKNSYVCKEKRRKWKKENLAVPDKIGNNCVDSNMFSVPFRNFEASENNWRILCSQKRRVLVKKLEESIKIYSPKVVSSKDSKISEDSSGSDSWKFKRRANIEDSVQEGKDAATIEIETSNEGDNDKDVVRINNDTDQDSSDRIEDADTQDVIPVLKNSDRRIRYDLALPMSKSVSIHSQASTKDSDNTFFSNAEEFPYTFAGVHPSQRISQLSMPAENVTDNKSKSSQSGVIISTETSPRKTHADAPVQLALLDSGKKRRKAKRGSLTEKLQSTINRQASFVRIWRHQLKQATKQGTPMPCVTVCVRAHGTRFGRQFFEAIVTQDPLNLLSRKGKSSSGQLIKIMIIPDIVGRVETRCQTFVQIFPPWEILDDKELILNATYVHVVPADNETNSGRCEGIANRPRRTVVQEFHCLCIDAKKMELACEDRFGKPNVIEKIFTCRKE